MHVTRRKFLKSTVIGAGTVAAMPRTTQARPRSRPQADQRAEYFPQSVASGDPRADSVILWTRALDPSRPAEDLDILAQVSTSQDFPDRGLVVDTLVTARADDDHCLRLKITGLDPDAFYYFRFVNLTAPGAVISAIGRTRTAPAPDADAAVKFAFLSCQDYIGRYYNTLLSLLLPANDNLNFVLHLGDYIYETAGGDFRNQAGLDPQRTYDLSGDGFWRQGIRLDRQKQQIPREDQDGFYDAKAANTVQDYRRTYQVYRTDPILQRVHEKFPFICTWDDHEFSDDAWGANTTYENGLQLEAGDPALPGNSDDWGPVENGRATGEKTIHIQRRLNAEQVYVEYMPLDDERGLRAGASPVAVAPEGVISTESGNFSAFASEDGRPDPEGGGGIRIWGSFRFGRHVELFVTDFRTFRPEHLIDTSAWPGMGLVRREELDPELQEAFDRLDETQTPPPLGDLTPPTSQKATLVNLHIEEAHQPGLAEALVAQLQRQYVDTYYSSMGYADRDNTADIRSGALRKARRALLGSADGDPAAPPDAYRVDAVSANALIADINAGAPVVPFSDLPFSDGDARPGLSYRSLGKIGLAGTFGGYIGGRYLCVKPAMDLYSEHLLRRRPSAVDVYGEEQETFLRTAIPASDATWKVVGSSVSFSSLILDIARDFDKFDFADVVGAVEGVGRILSASTDLDRKVAALVDLLGLVNLEKIINLVLNNQYDINCDQWDGFPAKKAQLLREVFIPNQCILLAGDIHSTYVSEFTDVNAPGRKAVCLTGPGVSSETFQSFIANALGNLQPVKDVLTQKLDLMFESGVNGSPRSQFSFCVRGVDSLAAAGVREVMPLARANEHGAAVIEFTAGSFRTTFYTTQPDRAELPPNPNAPADQPRQNNAVSLPYYTFGGALRYLLALFRSRHLVRGDAAGRVLVRKGTPDSTAPLHPLDFSCLFGGAPGGEATDG